MTNILLDGLIFKCPFNQELESCAFKDIRSKSIGQRLIVLSQLNAEKREELLEKHQNCLFRRELRMHRNNTTFYSKRQDLADI